MQLHLLLLTTVAIAIGGATLATAGCSYNRDVVPGQTYYVYSPGYPANYSAGVNCRWDVVAPSNSNLTLTCTDFVLPRSLDCVDDRLSVSPTGVATMSDAHLYCGKGTFSQTLASNRMVITLAAPFYSRGGRFGCSVTASVPSTPKPPTCDCGWKNQARIVNGKETGVNEYPMMAALVDLQTKDLFCGTTVIARRYTLSAAHCLLDKQPDKTGVLVGDHDITTGTETNSAELLIAELFIPHPAYDSVTQQNDIAVIRVPQDITFSLQVGPACLPFSYPNTKVGGVVVVLGWGTTEYTGAKSDRLMGTQLDIVDISKCQQYFGSKVSTTNQLCTYRSGTDACQADSGGPLLLMGNGSRLQVVGIISFSKGCAAQYPGVNTRVYSYIGWIMSVTPDAEYCVR